MDITSNAQASDGGIGITDILPPKQDGEDLLKKTGHAEAEQEEAGPSDSLVTDPDVVQEGKTAPILGQEDVQDSSGTLKPRAAQYGATTALNDLTEPPPSYDLGKYRRHFWQIHRPRNPPKPPPASLDDAPIIPLATASFITEFLYLWISPLMTLGYQRPLQATDLWKIDDKRTAAVLGEKLQNAYDKRQQKAREWNERLDAGKIKPSWYKKLYWRMGKGSYDDKYERWERRQRRHASLMWSLSSVVGWWFWGGGLSKVIGDNSQLMGPLVSKNLIQFAQLKAANKAAGLPIPGIGRGIGDAFGLLLLTISASVFQHFFFYRAMASGALMRAAMSNVIYKKALILSQSSRVKFNNGRLMAHLSTDISRIDYACQWIHAIWTAPIQIAVCTVLLLVQIGPSALVGLALFILLIPVQSKVMAWQVKIRKKSMQWTDARSRTLGELLASFAILKYFVFEQAYLKRIADIRANELLGVWKISLIKAGNQALALSLPTLAAVVSFLCYLGIGHTLNPAKIFTSFSLFQLLRQPVSLSLIMTIS